MSGSSPAGRAAQTDPELARAGDVLARLADAWRAMPAAFPTGVPSLDAARERVHNGIPALAEEPLLDGASLRKAVAAIGAKLAAVEGYEAAGPLAEELGHSALDWDSLAVVALSGGWDALADEANRLDTDREALAALLDYAARPALRAGAGRVRPLLAETAWSRSCCPACGAAPLLSITRGKEGARSLLCGRCGTAWSWPRTRCSACGEDDHRQLGYLHAPGEGDYRRVEVCDSCRGYLKTIAVLDLPDADGLLRLDLETAALDFIAVDAGYSRSGGATV